MTVPETLAAFKHYIDQFSTARASDIDFWINEGIEAFVKRRLAYQAQGPNTGFQINQRVRDDLSNIIKIDVTGSYANGVLSYPPECYELIPNSVGCQTAEQAFKSPKYVYARPRTWDWAYSNSKNPFVKPKYKENRLIYIESSDGINIFPIANYAEVVLSYVEKWLPFSESLDQPIPLKDKTHSEITRTAAAKYLSSIGNIDGAKVLLEQNVYE